jgi:hypothetical protein
MSTQKIELKGGYTNDYLPFGSYKNYTLLVAIANYSTNDVCNSNARFFLAEDITAEDKLRRLRGEGGFMSAVCKGDFAEAFKRADGSNRAALIQGLTNNEIEL